MINGKRVVALIPARGGSKRLPRKNILPLGGRPLIGWTIDAALNSSYIDEVFVSTDDQEIADVAAQFNVEVPELRPDYLSTDTATSKDVLFYTIKKLKGSVDIIVLLQPTSPFRNRRHIDEAIELLENKSAFSIVSVTPCEHPPQWANVLPSDGSMKNFIRTDDNKRSQDLQLSYRLNGAIYAYNTEKLLAEGEGAFRDDTYAYKMPNEYSIDIDNEIDFKMAEFLYEHNRGSI
ncbi:cytidylyltransferase domain-containing protein [Vibrio nomapromontoriensis]|uniref:acylneuraminate cytidylyltransferase family protein n=1 Tax=Vibrio nomapromontoriensis TaxID=2910246 RepID=UPI003D0BECF4